MSVISVNINFLTLTFGSFFFFFLITYFIFFESVPFGGSEYIHMVWYNVTDFGVKKSRKYVIEEEEEENMLTPRFLHTYRRQMQQSGGREHQRFGLLF